MQAKRVKAPVKADQLSVFEQGIRAFRAGEFSRAKQLFEKAAEGPSRDIAHRARSHVLMCVRRLPDAVPALTTAEEHYTYAVALINSRNLATARQHLEAALEMDPKADHIQYTMALCLGLSGDLEGSYTYLKRAIELRPQNRIAARQDADFAGFGKRPPLDRLLYPERS